MGGDEFMLWEIKRRSVMDWDEVLGALDVLEHKMTQFWGTAEMVYLECWWDAFMRVGGDMWEAEDGAQ